MNFHDNKLWFKAKKYGWGWSPCTWQGWLVTALYLCVVLYYVYFVEKKMDSASDLLYGALPIFILATIILLIIAYLKGEEPRWRWGK